MRPEQHNGRAFRLQKNAYPTSLLIDQQANLREDMKGRPRHDLR